MDSEKIKKLMKRIKKPSNPDDPNEKSYTERMGLRNSSIIPAPPKPATIIDRIAEQMPKAKDEKVVVKHSGGDFYRINWYRPFNLDNTIIANWKISDSRYYEITESGKTLIMKDKTRCDTPKRKDR